MSLGGRSIPVEFGQIIDEAVSLIDGSDCGQLLDHRPGAEPLPSLLDQCEQLCSEAALMSEEPIRTIHHFACTGGTLISKCVATCANTQLLSEVDPLSRKGHASNGKFLPTDLIGLVRSGTRAPDDELLIEIFVRGLGAVYDDACRKGQRLVLRDHAHSHFCVGSAVGNRPTLGKIVGDHYPMRTVVTVRHPLDSYLSLTKNGWRNFEPEGLEEYANRYQKFLMCYSSADTIRYEDFIVDPEGTMNVICEALALPFNEDFRESFSAITLSGDSGRKGTSIGIRERRAVPSDIREELRWSTTYSRLCEQLGYEPEAA